MYSSAEHAEDVGHDAKQADRSFIRQAYKAIVSPFDHSLADHQRKFGGRSFEWDFVEPAEIFLDPVFMPTYGMLQGLKDQLSGISRHPVTFPFENTRAQHNAAPMYYTPKLMNLLQNRPSGRFLGSTP